MSNISYVYGTESDKYNAYTIYRDGRRLEPQPLAEYIEKLESRIAELEAKQRWTPVSERFPKDGDEVIIWAQNGWEAATFLSNGVYGLPVWETLRNFDYELDTFDLVTHWKERPEPPEECQHEPA